MRLLTSSLTMVLSLAALQQAVKLDPDSRDNELLLVGVPVAFALGASALAAD